MLESLISPLYQKESALLRAYGCAGTYTIPSEDLVSNQTQIMNSFT